MHGSTLETPISAPGADRLAPWIPCAAPFGLVLSTDPVAVRT